MGGLMTPQIQCTLLSGFELDQTNRTFTLFTRTETEWGFVNHRIVFVDVFASRIGNIPDRDTLVNIHEVSPERIWTDGERLFRAYNSRSWPECFRSRHDFLCKLRSKFLHAFEIISDSGTAGWVISQDPIVTSTAVRREDTTAGKNTAQS